MSRFAKAIPLLRTLPRVGWGNAAAAGLYRARVALGAYGSAPDIAAGPLLHEQANANAGIASDAAGLLAEAEELRGGRFRAFGGAAREAGNPPRWLRNLLSGRDWPADRPWWRVKAPAPGDDIKGVWEASRFDWFLLLARAARAGGEVSHIALANRWAADWLACNPPYRGPNWQCGQETSIRLMQTLLAARLLEQDKQPASGLCGFARAHLHRIAQTWRYADAQDNNHAISEASALFAGGAWIAERGEREGAAWSAFGRRWLEDLMRRLVFDDGGFSQYSLNYHRVLLATLAQAEMWRRRLDLAPFSEQFRSRARAAALWMAALTNAKSGDAPNLGGNDGARPYRLDDGPYRDYRAAAQLGCALLADAAAFEPGQCDAPFEWLGSAKPPLDPRLAAKRTRSFPDFGLVLLNPRADGSGAYAFVRVPRDRFRPPQADPLHFDLWREDGRNLLRDAGSYSYADANAHEYFSSVAAHNTIGFDGRDSMPRVSRFLFADWIAGESEAPRQSGADVSWSGRVRDRHGASHRRTVTASANEWTVQDDIGDFAKEAVLRWRLAPGDAKLEGHTVENPHLVLQVEADGPPGSFRLTDAPESLTYAERHRCPGLEVAFGPATRQIRTRIRVK